MNIEDRLRHCAKHTGLDAVVELLNEAATHIEGLNSTPKLQGDPSWWMRETDEGAEWTDTAPLVLSGWTPLYTAPQPAQATQAEVTDAEIVAVMRDGNNCNYNDEAEHIQFARAILAMHTATQPCGHPASLVIRSAESGEVLYCEACDDKSGRRDAEMREGELLEANQKLRDEILSLRPERVMDVRCEGCGYMTHHREHMGCVRSAKQHTRPAPSAPKDDQIAALVNKVRDIARMFHDHQSLRERIAIELVPALKASQEVKSNAERWRYAIADSGNQTMNFIDIFDDWNGDGDFVEAFDKARLADKKEGSAA